MTFQRSLVSLILIPGVLTFTGFAKERWIRLESPNFEGVSNASEKKSKTLIRELEQFRHVFSDLFQLRGDRVPVTVFIFKNDKSFKVFKPVYDGKPANVAGFFQGNPDRNLIALNVNANQNPLHVIFHEYVHLLTSDTRHPWPLWLKEGLAELYSTFEVRGTRVLLGAAIPRHAQTLRGARIHSIAELFAISGDSSEYNERQKQGIFYAQSWALVHYLMFHDKSRLRPQLVRFVQLVWRGVEPLQAFEQALEGSFEDLENALQKYVHQQAVYSQLVRLEVIAAAEQIDVASLDESQIQAQLGGLLYYMGRLEEATVRLKEARRLAPESLQPKEGLALIALRLEDRETARGLLEEASEGGSRSYLVHYYYAEMLMDEVSRQPALNDLEFQSISWALREAIRLAPAFDRAYYLLARAYRQWKSDLDEGLRMIDRALALKPQSDYYQMARADLLLEKQDYESSEVLFQKLVGSAEEGIRQYAEQNLEYLARLRQQEKAELASFEERRKLLAELSRESESEKGPAGKAEVVPAILEDAQRPPLRPARSGAEDGSEGDEGSGSARRPCTPTFAGTSSIQPIPARLLRVDCSGANIRYWVEIDGRETSLVGRDPGQPVLFSCTVRVKEMRCGSFDYDALIYFAPGREREAETGALKVVAIEFN